ncbi:hypothetical protein T492DRAFT_1103202 [Pavlovales sp. CCMP2436]|nr:hypothetical protein T492DRAFT_1103202 [Pavlovales sp. CCMP2436]
MPVRPFFVFCFLFLKFFSVSRLAARRRTGIPLEKQVGELRAVIKRASILLSEVLWRTPPCKGSEEASGTR